MIDRIMAIGAAFSLALAAGAVQADDVGGEDIVIPMVVEEQTTVESVQAAPPPFVTVETKTIAAGLGISWGKGELLFEGERYAFTVNGVSLVDLGISAFDGEGWVQNLERLSDFEGTYVAVEAGAAAGVGASKMTMRNEHGVVIALSSELQGVQLTLGTEGLRIAFE